MTQLFKEYRAGKAGGRYWIVMGQWGVEKKSHQRVISEPNECHMVWRQVFGILKLILGSMLLLCNNKRSWNNPEKRCENTEVRIISVGSLVTNGRQT